MSDERTGIATALEMINATAEPAPEGDQSDMFEADAPMPIAQRAASVAKVGRPRGARNRSTEEWREYLLSRYRSPLVALLEMCNRSPLDLAKDLGLKRTHFVGTGVNRIEREVWDLQAAAAMQMDAHKAVLPYLHQKQPMAIELPAESDAPLLVIGSLNVSQSASGGAQIPLADSEQNQSVIDVTPEKSDAQKSDDA